MKCSFVKLKKLLFNAPYKSFYADVGVCDIPKARTVTLLLYTDWMMPKDASNQRGPNDNAPSAALRMLVAWKDAFPENYLAILAEQKR